MKEHSTLKRVAMLFFHHKTNAKISINWKVLHIFEH